MARKMPNPAAGQRGRVAVVFDKLAGNQEDLTAIHPNSQLIAARMIARRFGFAPATARAVAELAGFSMAGAA